VNLTSKLCIKPSTGYFLGGLFFVSPGCEAENANLISCVEARTNREVLVRAIE
jgi:hypothetical protein